MSKILSQEEIDALLTSAADIDDRVGGRPGRARAADGTQDVVSYNFRCPDRISKEQIRSLHFLHDRFARTLTTSLSAFLRTVTEVTITGVEQCTYAEFLLSLPDPTAFYAISMAPLEGVAALELNPGVAFTMIDRMLGGSGRGPVVARALTDIEQHVIDAVLKLTLETLTETWRGAVDVTFAVTGRETRPQMLQIAAPGEVIVLLGFDVRLGDTRGTLNLCVPASILEQAGAAFTRTWHRTRRDPTSEDRRCLLENLGAVALPVSASLSTTLPARDVLQLAPGDVISLDHPAGEPLDVRVRGARKFEGRLVRQGRRTGIVIASAVPVNGHGAAEQRA